MTSTDHAPDAAGRILSLAAYAAAQTRSHTPITLTSIADDVPGYATDAARDEWGDLKAGTTEWEAVRKKLQRDINDLREAWGISLDYDEAEHCYRLAPPFFTTKERQALIAALATVDVEGLPSTKPGELGAGIDDSGASVILRLHTLVTAFRPAIGNRNPVSFEYDGRTRTVEPYALGMWRNHWYLAGRALDAAAEADDEPRELRRFRLDRIESPLIKVDTARTYEIPDDFDADTAFDLDPNSWGTDPLLRAQVRLNPDHVHAFLAELGGEVVGNDGNDNNGAVLVEIDVRHYGSFRTRLLAFGRNAVVLSPPELVEVVRAHLLALAGGDD